MGMFDSVMFKCPKCGHRIEAQSKSGDCMLNVYAQNEVPEDVLDALKIYDACQGCGTKYKLSKPTPVIVPTVFYSIELEEITEDEVL
jgi:hypothetical protein